MVVAVNKNNESLVAISVRREISGMKIKDALLNENLPFWKVRGVDDCYVFAESRTHSGDVIGCCTKIFKELTDEQSIVEKVIPKLKELINNETMQKKENSWDNSLIIVKGTKLYEIDSCYLVRELKDRVVSFASDYIMCAIEDADNMPVEDAILTAFRSCNKVNNRNHFPVLLFNPKTKTKKIFYK